MSAFDSLCEIKSTDPRVFLQQSEQYTGRYYVDKVFGDSLEEGMIEALKKTITKYNLELQMLEVKFSQFLATLKKERTKTETELKTKKITRFQYNLTKNHYDAEEKTYRLLYEQIKGKIDPNIAKAKEELSRHMGTFQDNINRKKVAADAKNELLKHFGYAYQYHGKFSTYVVVNSKKHFFQVERKNVGGRSVARWVPKLFKDFKYKKYRHLDGIERPSSETEKLINKEKQASARLMAQGYVLNPQEITIDDIVDEMTASVKDLKIDSPLLADDVA